MTWTALAAAIHFYDGTESWSATGMTAMSTSDQADFLSRMQSLYTNSPTFAATMDAFLLGGDSLGGLTLNILGDMAGYSGVGGNVVVPDGAGQVNIYYFRMNDLDTSLLFNDEGTVVQTNASLTIAHELFHGISGMGDPDTEASNTIMNGNGYDFDGPQVVFQNAIAVDMGWAEDVRASYMGQVSADFASAADWDLDRNYTLDRPIDEMRYGDISGDNIDHSAKADNAMICYSAYGATIRSRAAEGMTLSMAAKATTSSKGIAAPISCWAKPAMTLSQVAPDQTCSSAGRAKTFSTAAMVTIFSS